MEKEIEKYHTPRNKVFLDLFRNKTKRLIKILKHKKEIFTQTKT
jgi:hypothetical protein